MLLRRWVITGFLSMPALACAASAPAHMDAAHKVFRLDSPASTYAMGVNERGELQPIYWGARLADDDHLAPPHTLPSAGAPDASTSITPQEFAGWGQGIYHETGLKISFPDGNRDLELRYADAKADGDALLITLKDIDRAIVVTLRYTMDQATGIVGRSAHIENRTSARVVVDEAAAATWFLPSQRQYTLEYLAGRWGGEFQLERQSIGPGKVVLESRRGSTGHQNSPWFALQAGETPTEEHGDTWFGTLAWSGSWSIEVEQDVVHTVRVTGGYNPFDFAYGLKPGEALDTPVFYAGYSPDGWGGASRALHRFELGTVVPGAPTPKLRPVLYNSWEATRFALNAEGQMQLADVAAKVGVERFVIDDAWFGHRTTDRAGLGDWYVNTDKFPGGLKPLIDKVHSLRMDFGLWVEPEMVNPDSDLYRAHPDWVLHFEGRPRTESRHQLVLNLARADVREYVFHAMDDLLTQNEITFLKWDYNRSFSEPGWPAATDSTMRGEQEKLYVLFTQNLYDILARLRARHPGVEIESCASGGGRVDLGILRYTDQVWPSDNMDAFDRLGIQGGLSQFLSPGLSMAWVTHSPDFSSGRVASLRYRFLSAMQVGLGIGDDLRGWSDADVKEAASYVTAYKAIRETVQRGSLFRLISPVGGSEQSVTEYVSQDRAQAVVFAFLHSVQMGYPFPVVRPQGLEPDARYKVQSIAGKLVAGAPEVESGAFWMHAGMKPDLKGDFNAAAFTLTRVP